MDVDVCVYVCMIEIRVRVWKTKNKIQYSEDGRGASSQNQALRRWNFHAFFPPISMLGNSTGTNFNVEIYSHSIYAKWSCRCHLEGTWLLGVTTELRESEHLVSISISARKKGSVNERGAKPQKERERMIMRWKSGVAGDDRSNSLADDTVGCFVRGYKRD